MLGIMFSFPFPIAKVGNLIFHSHSQSQNLRIIFFIPIPNPKNLEKAGPFPIPNPKCEKLIPAHAWQGMYWNNVLLPVWFQKTSYNGDYYCGRYIMHDNNLYYFNTHCHNKKVIEWQSASNVGRSLKLYTFVIKKPCLTYYNIFATFWWRYIAKRIL